jgi:hypothetical protein
MRRYQHRRWTKSAICLNSERALPRWSCAGRQGRKQKARCVSGPTGEGSPLLIYSWVLPALIVNSLLNSQMPPARLSRPDGTVDREVLTLIDAQHARRAWHWAPSRLHRAGHRQARAAQSRGWKRLRKSANLFRSLVGPVWAATSSNSAQPRWTATPHRIATSIALRHCCARRFAHRRGCSRLKRLFGVEQSATIRVFYIKTINSCGWLVTCHIASSAGAKLA